jgi:MFS family permease
MQSSGANATLGQPNLGQSVETPYPKSGYAWTVVAILLFAYMTSLIDRQILSLLVQPVRQDLGISDTQLSILIGFAFAMFYSTLAVVFGGLADRFNRRNMIIVGITLWSIATIGCGLAQNFTELFIGRMLVGVGEAVLGPAAYSMIADYFPKDKRSRAAAVFTMGAFMGGGAAFIFGGAVVDLTTQADGLVLPFIGSVKGWQAAFIIVGLPGLVIGPVLCLIREPIRREVGKSSVGLRNLWRFMARNRALLSLIVVGYGTNGLINVGLMTWLPAQFIRVHGWSAGDIGLSYGLIQLIIGSAGVATGGWWVSRRGAAPGTVLRTSSRCLLIMAPLAVAAGLAGSPYVALIALSLIAFPIGWVAGLAPAAIYEIAPNEFRGQLVSFYLMAGTVLPYCFGIVAIAAFTDYVFQSDLAVGKSMAIVLSLAVLVGSTMLHLATRLKVSDT